MSVYCSTHQTIRQQIWEEEPERLIPTPSPPTHTHTYTLTADDPSQHISYMHACSNTLQYGSRHTSAVPVYTSVPWSSGGDLRDKHTRFLRILPQTARACDRMAIFRKMLCLELISCLLKDANYKNLGQKHTKVHKHRCKRFESMLNCWWVHIAETPAYCDIHSWKSHRG